MLKIPKQADLKKLKNIHSTPCISFYMPIDEDSKDSLTANRITFKNLVAEAQDQLLQNSLTKKESNQILAKAKELLEDTNFWKIRREGLAVFTNGEHIEYYGIPKSIAHNSVTVGPQYDTDPMADMINNNSTYYVLSLGYKGVQLLEGDKYHIQDITPMELPTDMKKALNIDEQPTHLDNHEVSRVRGDQSNRSFHGQFNIKEENKKDLVNFFRLLDQRINGLMHKAGNPPLILAGVDYLLPLYRQANTYVNLSRQHISKNIRHMQPKDILNDIKPLLKKNMAAM